MTAKLSKAILKVEAMHNEAAAYIDKNDVPGEWLDEGESWKDWESEAEAREAEATREAYSTILVLLYAIQAEKD